MFPQVYATLSSWNLCCLQRLRVRKNPRLITVAPWWKSRNLLNSCFGVFENRFHQPLSLYFTGNFRLCRTKFSRTGKSWMTKSQSYVRVFVWNKSLNLVSTKSGSYPRNQLSKLPAHLYNSAVKYSDLAHPQACFTYPMAMSQISTAN